LNRPGFFWIHEIKHDGYRSQVVTERGQVRVFRTARRITGGSRQHAIDRESATDRPLNPRVLMNTPPPDQTVRVKGLVPLS